VAVPSRAPVNLLVELQALFGFYEPLADEQGVRLEAEGSGTVEGDRLMIRRALSNLLANAIRHTPKGSTVSVQLARRADGGVTLGIRNPGSIAHEHLPRLFERFYQVEPSRHSAVGRAGLGLAITQSIVAAHGGTIRAESDSGEVRFTIDWPVASVSLPAEAKPAR
jgi:two-component system heavy metal sensor histidine kinase CusS